MINLLRSGFLILLLLSGCGYNGTPTRHNDFVPLTSIEIVPVVKSIADNHTIAALTSTRLTVKGNFSGKFTRDITDQVTWSSSSPSTVAGFVTTVQPNRVTGVAAGPAILTATVGSVSNTFNLTVSTATIKPNGITITPVDSNGIPISPVDPTIPKGLTRQYTASGTFSDGTTQDLTFDAAWDSSDPTIASVSNDPVSKGFVRALTENSAQISITATFPTNGVIGTTLLTVTAPVLQSIAVTPANPSVLSLSTAKFTATGTYSDGISADITNTASWSSSIPTLATIVADGTATTLAQGTTSIGATLNGVTGTTNLKVTGGTLKSFALSIANKTMDNNGNISLAKDTIGRLIATGFFSNGSSRDITGVFSWSVDPSFATVSTSVGNLVWFNAIAITPVTPATTITGIFENLIATTNLTVTTATLDSIVISPVALNLTAGTTARFSAIGTFSDKTTQDVTASATWLSGEPTIASVGNLSNSSAELANKGRVSGVNAAVTPVTISATQTGIVTPATASVTVTPRTIQSLSILPSPATVASGNQVKFTATAIYQGFTQDVTEDTIWSIDKPNVAILSDSVNQPGQIVGVDGATGTATLTATFGGITKSITITVTP